MTKCLKLEQHNAHWRVPLKVIADHRAKYYVLKDKMSSYAEEYEFCMNDSYEAVDWYLNNMNWEDVEKYAERTWVASPPIKPDNEETDVYIVEEDEE